MAGKSKIWSMLTGDYVAAGDMYYREGNLAKAAALYARAGNFKEAARLCAEAGMSEQAVDFFIKAGLPLRAGEMLAAQNQHKEAIPYFEQAAAYWPAAESALKLKQTLRAARYFEKASALGKAAECYEAAGEIEESLRLWEKEAVELKRRARTDPEAVKKGRKVDLHRSKVLVKLGRLNDAAALLREWGMSLNAAQLLERSGEFDKAVEAYLQAGQAERALALLPKASGVDKETQAQIYKRCGRHGEAAKILEEMDRPADAAEMYEAAGEWAEAGRLWEAVEEPSRAAELYYRGDALSDAARCYAKAKNLKLAAETYGRIGEHQSAAEAFVQIDEPLRAAKHFIKAGDKSSASKALQSIPPETKDFEQATLILVPLLVQDKLYDGALHRLQLLPERPSAVGAMAVERLYWEARIYDALDDLDKAEVLYQKAIAVRHDHRDLAARLEALRQRKEEKEKRETGEAALAGGTVQLEKGQVLLDRYEIIDEIGRGGMSRVYKARDRDLDELVAIKTLQPRAGDQLRSEERLLREVQICRRITHPNVVRVYDIGRLPGGIFVTMELLEGMTLDRLISEGKGLPLDRVKQMLNEILLGLREAHGLKIIHRDLKPANVALTSKRAKIMDFGIAHIEGMDVSLTQTGQVVGSPMYMSPEQIQGQPLDARSDLYSFGVLAFTLLAGHEPFTGNTPTAISLKHLQEAPPNILEERSDLDPAWGDFIHRLLAKQPTDRYQSAEDTLAMVEKLPA